MQEETDSMPLHGEPTIEYLVPEFVPSEAQGTYAGKQFYFYARFNWWGFAMSDVGRTDPAIMLDIYETGPERRAELFTPQANADFDQSFVRVEHKYGKGEFAASYMPEKEIRRLINHCIEEFEADLAK
jgi:hypothetical protein